LHAAPAAYSRLLYQEGIEDRVNVTTTQRINIVQQLTTLPGEVRNIIYQYVLSEKGGLMVWIDPACTRRLCRQHVRERAAFAYFFSNHTDRSTIDFNQLQYVNRLFWAETHGIERQYNKVQKGTAAQPK
jgi:hypothetical protein